MIWVYSYLFVDVFVYPVQPLLAFVNSNHDYTITVMIMMLFTCNILRERYISYLCLVLN